MGKMIKNVSLAVMLAIFLTSLSISSGSSLLFEYMKSNIINVIFTVLAIQIGIVGVLITKLIDIAGIDKMHIFSRSIREMKISLIEQLCTLAISLLTVVVAGSDNIKEFLRGYYLLLLKYPVFEFYTQVTITATTIYSALILYDLAKAIIVLANTEES